MVSLLLSPGEESVCELRKGKEEGVAPGPEETKT